MYLPNPRPALLLLPIFALAFAGCDRKGIDLNAGRAEDPRIAKRFSASEPEFCTFEMIYSDASGIVKNRYVVTGQNKAAMLSNFAATCAKSAAAPKVECGKYLSDKGAYPCVAPSLFIPGPETAGVWTCKLPFSVDDRSETIVTETKSTAAAAITEAFYDCAELTDDESSPSDPSPLSETITLATSDFPFIPDSPVPTPSASPSPGPSASPSPTPAPSPVVYLKPSKRRDACAVALIERKLVCENANVPTQAATPPRPIRRLTHGTKR